MSLDSQKLLDLAKAAEQPSEADLIRVRAKLDMQLGGLGLLVHGKAGLASGSIAPKALGSISVLKWFSVLVLATAPIGYVALRSEAPTAVAQAPTPSASAMSPALPEPESQPLPVATSMLALPAIAESLEVAAPSSPHSDPATPAAPRARAFAATGSDDSATDAPAPSGESVIVPPVSSAEMAIGAPAAPPLASSATPRALQERLARELPAIRRAEDELRAGEPQGALHTLATYLQEHPRGVLRQEHDALQILALCQLGQNARQAIETFERNYPRSLSLSRIHGACGQPR